MDAEEKKPLST